MNILSAIYSGQMGFLKAGQSMAEKASRISEFAVSEDAQESAAQDLVGLQLDAVQAKASMRAIKVADNVLQELVQPHLKK